MFSKNQTVRTRRTVPRDASPDLSRRFLCPVGPGQKSAGRAGPGQVFAGLPRPLPIPGLTEKIRAAQYYCLRPLDIIFLFMKLPALTVK